MMQWVVYDANGAKYTGYASVDIGRLIGESQPVMRTGYVKSGVASLSQTTYAALWNWAKHHDLVKNTASWSAGTLFYRDNGNGTFTPPDVRGEFVRYWDNGRGVDLGRAFGSWQGDAIRDITGTAWGVAMGTPYDQSYFKGVFSATEQSSPGITLQAGNSSDPRADLYFSASGSGVPTASENRPRGFSELAVIKF